MNREKYDEVGCRNCGSGGNWQIWTDGKKVVKASCRLCGHSVIIADVELKTEPDQKKFDLRMMI